jgi:multisubunit Na+/H+ antiporter MnhB subunit
MSTLGWLFDGLLGATLLWLGAQTVFGRGLFGSVVSFIALGMLMALAWLRLGAPDVALAEAALGGGVTGALLLAALNRLGHSAGDERGRMTAPQRYRPLIVVLALLLIIGVVGMLVWALYSLPPEASGLSAQVRDRLPESGVRAEVTAVLLNFRGYDTLLELAVLLAALLGAWHLGPLSLPRGASEPGPVLESLVRLLVPVMVLVTGYVLWLGGHTAGGAFQAGALLAGAGVLLLVVRPDVLGLRDRRRLRALIIVGPGLFTLVAGAVMFAGGVLLEYPREHAGGLILLIEAATTVSIGITLTLLFAGGHPHRGGGE